MSRKIEARRASGNDHERMGVLTHSKLQVPDRSKVPPGAWPALA
jgi:hypothetical protein